MKNTGVLKVSVSGVSAVVVAPAAWRCVCITTCSDSDMKLPSGHKLFFLLLVQLFFFLAPEKLRWNFPNHQDNMDDQTQLSSTWLPHLCPKA